MLELKRDRTPFATIPGCISGRYKAILVLLVIAGTALCPPYIAHAGGKVELAFNPANFSDPTTIDNAYFPLVPGTEFTYKAEGEDGCEWVVVNVTFDTHAVAAGVTGRVVHDRAYEDENCDGFSDSELVEDTYDWFAQDNAGNVWYLGEASYDCEGAGNCVFSAGSWEAGADVAGAGYNAAAGIQMLATPLRGSRYYQEYYEEFAEDQALVMSDDVKVEGPFVGSLQHCIVTKEWTALERGEIEHKFYCPEIGLVAGDELKGKTLHVNLVQMTP